MQQFGAFECLERPVSAIFNRVLLTFLILKRISRGLVAIVTEHYRVLKHLEICVLLLFLIHLIFLMIFSKKAQIVQFLAAYID